MPCDTWLRLDQYQEGQPVGKAAWLGQQLDTLVSANKHAIKSIQKTTLRNKLCAGGDELHIPIGNHILLRDHPEGQNKFKDQYKSDVYIVVDSHKEEPNVYYIQPLDDTQRVKPKAVNWRELFDLNRSSPQSESQDSEIVDDQIPQLPLLFPDKTFKRWNNNFLTNNSPIQYKIKKQDSHCLWAGSGGNSGYTFVIYDISIPCYIRHMCSFEISYFM